MQTRWLPVPHLMSFSSKFTLHCLLLDPARVSPLLESMMLNFMNCIRGGHYRDTSKGRCCFCRFGCSLAGSHCTQSFDGASPWTTWQPSAPSSKQHAMPLREQLPLALTQAAWQRALPGLHTPENSFPGFGPSSQALDFPMGFPSTPEQQSQRDLLATLQPSSVICEPGLHPLPQRLNISVSGKEIVRICLFLGCWVSAPAESGGFTLYLLPWNSLVFFPTY